MWLPQDVAGSADVVITIVEWEACIEVAAAVVISASAVAIEVPGAVIANLAISYKITREAKIV